MLCITKPLHYGEVLPGWFLMKATKNAYSNLDPDGPPWKADQWALCRYDLPEYVWTVNPIKDPCFGLTDEEITRLDISTKKFNDFEDSLFAFEKEIYANRSDPLIGYRLVDAAIQAGYNQKIHGFRFLDWLFHYLAVWIESHEGIPEDDFNKLETNSVVKS